MAHDTLGAFEPTATPGAIIAGMNKSGNPEPSQANAAKARGEASSLEKDNSGELKALRPGNPVFALGLAVDYLMTKTPFSNLKFGDWSRVLTGQINRNHYFFVMQDGRAVGFCGWAFADRSEGEAWLSGKSVELDDASTGDSLIINIWEAASNEVNDFMRAQMRKIGRDKQMLYARRVSKDGSVRPVRLKVNQFVGSHIAAQGN